MHPLDERVLRHDEPAAQVRGVVLDRPSEAEAIEFGQEAELTELRELHPVLPAVARSRPRRG